MLKFFSALFLCLVPSLYADDKKGEWIDLFNGKDLTGWENPYDFGEAKVVDGEIQLMSKGGKFFLCTLEKFSDFEFTAQIKMPEGKSNSGFMFRCHKDKTKKHRRVWGYQAEVDPSPRKWSGGLYDEGRRKWLNPLKGQAKRQNAFKRHDWNTYRIVCKGSHIQIFVNDVMTTDFIDDMDKEGYIGLQHHGEKGKVYRFRNIRIKKL